MAEVLSQRQLTPAQLEVFEFVVAFIGQAGYPPTRQEICDGIGFCSPNAAQEHLKRIAAKGWIEIGKGARCLRVLVSRTEERHG